MVNNVSNGSRLYQTLKNPRMYNKITLILIIVIIAIILRIAAVFISTNYKHPDTWEYGRIAENVLSGKGYSYNYYWIPGQEPIPSSIQGPLYVYFLVTGYLLPHKFLAIQIFQSLIWGLACFLVYGAILELGENKRIALFAAICTALYPALIFSATQIHHTTFTFTLLTGAMWSFIRAHRTGSYRTALVAGLLFGIYALNEPVVFGFLPFGLIWFIWRRKKNVIAAAFVIAATAVTILPWMVRNYYVHKEPVLVKSGTWQVFWIGNNPSATGSLRNKRFQSIFPEELPDETRRRIRETPTEIGRMEILRDEALTYIRENPGRTVSTDLKKIAYLWWFDPYHRKDRHPLSWVPWQFLLLFAGAGVILKGREIKRYTPIILLLISYAITYAVFVPSPRYKFVFIPYFLALAGTTFMALGADVKKYICPNRSGSS